MVVGNCGLGLAPSDIDSAAVLAGVNGWMTPDGVEPGAVDVGAYLDRIDRDGVTVNVGMLIPHGPVRVTAMGLASGAPDPAQLTAMRDAVARGLDSGAFGLSTGLIYEPGCHARTEEIIELVAEMGGSTRLYTTHMRDEGIDLLPSIEEALRIGREAGVGVQISHHKAAGRPSWGLVHESLALIERAQQQGQTVFADQYPYTAGSTILEAIVRNEMVSDRDDAPSTPADIVLASCAPHPEWEGRSLADLGELFGCTGMEAADRVLAEAPNTTVITHMMNEDDVRTVMAHPSTMIGSDGVPTIGAKPHPRLSNTFARVLGHYARDEGVLTMAEAVRKMTGFAADTFGLDGRGYVRAGDYADLVVFDPATVEDRGTFADPTLMPVGFRHVFVNGTEVVTDGEHTGARPGVPVH